MDVPELNLAVLTSFILDFFQESEDISFRVLFDEGLVISTLWVEYWLFRFNLSHRENTLDFPKNNFPALRIGTLLFVLFNNSI